MCKSSGGLVVLKKKCMQVYGCFMSAILNGVPRIRFGIAVLYDDFLSQFHSKKCVQMADTWIDAGYSSAGSDLSEIDFREDVAISRSFPGFPGPEDWLDLSGKILKVHVI